MNRINQSITKLSDYLVKSGFKGYDPYDTLNSTLPISKMGKWVSAVAIQFQKRNPINIRTLLGVKKGYNPKGMGLMLKAYCLRYKQTNKEEDKHHADFLFEWLKTNSSYGYSGRCWGYNFDWANPGGTLKAYSPSVVVTAFVIDGIWEYYHLTKNEDAKQMIISSADYIMNDLPRTSFDYGLSIAYTQQSTGACYNASLLGAETLMKAYSFTHNEDLHAVASKAVAFVISKQKKNGAWYYSYNPEKRTERKQIDFHQGFILVSLYNYLHLLNRPDRVVDSAIAKGLEFYKKEQFYKNGQALWRLPKKYPTEIHNQAQGIITFSLLKEYDDFVSCFF